ncbi:hypothetical protein SBDP2_2090005 [Syntrophobacter sp. SbD2]|nr:hypothetical protein SBDP2_2090005 [Syntrophobacter sp. SbD2]
MLGFPYRLVGKWEIAISKVTKMAMEFPIAVFVGDELYQLVEFLPPPHKM